jgi:hypothetical protein
MSAQQNGESSQVKVLKMQRILLSAPFLFLACTAYGLNSQVLDSPEWMSSLEKNGLNIAQMLFNQKSSANNARLSQNEGYLSIANTLSADLDKLQAADKYLSVTMAKKHRLFDKRWLKSKDAYFELIGIAPRFDMAPFGNDQFGCGETRLLYRLAYEKKWRGNAVYSRLPLTLNVVYWNADKQGDGESCTKLARKWKKMRRSQLAAHLKTISNEQNLKSVEVNLQAVRWPSTVRPDFGGYAEYILRVFTKKNKSKRFEPSSLLNTLDVSKIKRSKLLKKELLSFITNPENIKKADQGIARIPEKFLAKKAVSFAFHGSHRLANRQLEQIYSKKEFSKIDFSKYTSFKTSGAWMRKLQDHSCVSCHQGRSIAGFHFVGRDRKKSFAANRVYFAKSGHLREDEQRRERYFQNLVQGKNPDPSRGFSERNPSEPGTYGAHCSLGLDKSFVSWTCARGLTCQKILANKPASNLGIGNCLPIEKGKGGDPSELGLVTQAADSRRDRVVDKKNRACSEGYYSFDARDGFPSGLCYRDCPSGNALGKKLSQGEACGLIAFNGFNPCLAKGEAFTKCLSEFTGELVLRKCSENAPCRDDFVCSQAKAGGVCIPPYFLFQLRLDGHPKPS